LRLFLLVLDEHERRELMPPRMWAAVAMEDAFERMGASAQGEGEA
jgi:hypothetical protein